MRLSDGGLRKPINSEATGLDVSPDISLIRWPCAAIIGFENWALAVKAHPERMIPTNIFFTFLLLTQIPVLKKNSNQINTPQYINTPSHCMYKHESTIWIDEGNSTLIWANRVKSEMPSGQNKGSHQGKIRCFVHRLIETRAGRKIRNSTCHARQGVYGNARLLHIIFAIVKRL